MFDNLFTSLVRSIAPPVAEGPTVRKQLETYADARCIVADAGFSETIKSQALARLARYESNGLDHKEALGRVMKWACENDDA